MNIFRFLPNGSAVIHKGELKNRILYVSSKECYGMKTKCIGYIWRSRLFGFIKPKREQIVTVRVGDGTPLSPLLKHYISDDPVDEYDLRDYENEFFLSTQLDVEKNRKTGERTRLDKLLWVLIGCAVAVFLIIAVGKNFTSVIDGFSGEGSSTNLFSNKTPIENNKSETKSETKNWYW
tara:strand:+ start:262 stop:795 length:534 start_codon:yes stop_codon:yes gene_type:complete